MTCFRACNTGPYWAHLSGLRVTSEIVDLKYPSDSGAGNKSWNELPNKEQVFKVLKATGSAGIVGLFEYPPAADQGWEHLEGLYYFHRL